METLTRPILDWSRAAATLPSEQEIGDCGEVHAEGSRAFIFAVDALGHGPEAASVAEKARHALLESNGLSTLEGIFEHCHQRLRGTRGAAMCLAIIDAMNNSLSWLSVGNIQAIHVQSDRHGLPRYQSLIMRGGVVGDRLPELRVSHSVLSPGDMLVFATDGIGYDWHPAFNHEVTPDELCSRIISRHRHGNDDALVLAIRYNGLGFGS